MLELIRKYPLAIVLSVLLHIALVTAMIVKLNREPVSSGLDMTGDAPIQAVAVSEADIQAEVERLKQLDEKRAQEAIAEQQALESTVAALEDARAAAEARLKEAEALTEQQTYGIGRSKAANSGPAATGERTGAATRIATCASRDRAS